MLERINNLLKIFPILICIFIIGFALFSTIILLEINNLLGHIFKRKNKK